MEYYAAIRSYSFENWLCENALVEVFPCIGEKQQCMVGRTWLLAGLGLTSSVFLTEGIYSVPSSA